MKTVFDNIDMPTAQKQKQSGHGQSAFSQAARHYDATRCTGWNGHTQFTPEGVGSRIVVFLDKFIRGLPLSDICDHLVGLVREAQEASDFTMMIDIFVAIMATRNIRGGKEEKKICYQAILVLYTKYPETILDLIELLPHYGYWKDLLELCRIITQNELTILDHSFKAEWNMITEKTAKMFAKQITADYDALHAWAKEWVDGYSEKMNHSDLAEKIWDTIIAKETEKEKGFVPPNISWAGKWAPREKKKYARKAGLMKQNKKGETTFVGTHKLISDEMGKIGVKGGLGEYRHRCSAPTHVLGVAEKRMCARMFRTVKWGGFGGSTSGANKTYRNAFLNLTRGKKDQKERSDSEDRRQCAEHFKEANKEGKTAGKTCDLASLSEEAFQAYQEDICDSVNAQYLQKKKGLMKDIAEERARLKEAGVKLTGGLASTVVTVDVSASMTWDNNALAMKFATACGVLVSEVQNPAYGGFVYTFSSQPRAVFFGEDQTFCEKIKKIRGMDVGGSTNFEATCDLIIDMIKRGKLKEEDIPDTWLILSDMQINQACACGYYGSASRDMGTMHERIKAAFARLGQEMYGHPIDPPVIVFWNLNATTVGMPTSAGMEGAVCVSGYSPALLKKILSGELTIKDDDGKRKEVDSEEMARRILDDEQYDKVRDVCFKHSDELASGFRKKPPILLLQIADPESESDGAAAAAPPPSPKDFDKEKMKEDLVKITAQLAELQQKMPDLF